VRSSDDSLLDLMDNLIRYLSFITYQYFFVVYFLCTKIKQHLIASFVLCIWKKTDKISIRNVTKT
jgi:hypothetical protein